MKTKWGSCNHRSGHIRLNTELVKKPKDLLEYVVIHEMVHLMEPRHSERFVALMNEHYPSWREARAELNELPLAAADWGGCCRRSYAASCRPHAVQYAAPDSLTTAPHDAHAPGR